MIAGAPASGKGTQCELIKAKYGLVHISAGDLLRAEIATGTDNGKQAKEFMEKGQLVPDEIVVNMVKGRLLQPDAQEKGWLLDGYPRSYSQAMALETLGIRPDIFILLDVPDELLVERVVGRRLDPETGKIYHLKYSPPENEEIASRLTQRFDDTEEKPPGGVSRALCNLHTSRLGTTFSGFAASALHAGTFLVFVLIYLSFPWMGSPPGMKEELAIPLRAWLHTLEYTPYGSCMLIVCKTLHQCSRMVKLRLQTHYQNIESLVSIYEDVIVKVNGNTTVEDVFGEIEKLLTSSLDKKTEMVAS
ncbi:unnamed protein product [Triticum turgidum subsp. durum]|nr:unnamed protein product [Triticum turgidum subsp. durum]